MTTIAYDGTTIAADGLMLSGTERVATRIKKIRVSGGRIYALSGLAAMLEPLIKWHAEGADPGTVPKATGDNSWSMIVLEHGKPLTLFTSGCQYPDEYSEGYFFAIGSGQDYALGAMHAGKSAREAVEIAAKIDTSTGGEIMEINIAETFGAVIPAQTYRRIRKKVPEAAE